ncbi:MAG TPA: lysylphosphatidylglycerol synthase transmembrane domain-containing protein [Vicinamibacterales bacterium]
MTQPGFVDVLAQASLATLVYAISIPIVAERWRTVLGGVTGERLPRRPLVLASLASSFVNNLTAGPAGDACRIIAVVKLRFASASRATAAALYERVSEIPVIALMIATAIAVLNRGRVVRLGSSRTIWIIVIAITVVAAGLGLCRRTIAAAWLRWRERHDLTSIAIAPRVLAQSAAWSVVVWGLDVTRLWLIARAFGVSLSPAQAAALSAISVVGGWAPTIGGLGVVEGGLVAGLIAFGVPSGSAIAITAVERGISYGLATAIGACALAALGGRELWAAARATAAGART